VEEALKNRIILALVILLVIFSITTFKSCADASRYKKSTTKEMGTRMDCEEKLNNFTKEKTGLENKLNSLSQQLEESSAALSAAKKALLQEQLVSESLKEEVQKITKLKEALEEDLKNALVKTKTKK